MGLRAGYGLARSRNAVAMEVLDGGNGLKLSRRIVLRTFFMLEKFLMGWSLITCAGLATASTLRTWKRSLEKLTTPGEWREKLPALDNWPKHIVRMGMPTRQKIRTLPPGLFSVAVSNAEKIERRQTAPDASPRPFAIMGMK